MLLIFMAGTGELAGHLRPGRGLCPSIGPPISGIDQRRLQRPGKANARTKRAQWPRGRQTDPQRMRDRLSAVKMWKLTEYLDLSEEQAGKFFPRTREHQEEMDKLIQQQRQLYEDFQQKIDDSKVGARDVDRYIAETTRLGKALIELRTKHLQSLKDILTDEQLARFAVFNEHFRRQIGQGLRRELPPEGADQPEENE
ncbi:MAG: hypothetical protein JSU77_05155 [Fidelibacterota bacterium]|nr:MAG: hypothetical protein JSU77_05155 [Candidatus Neomarinimicrobiota bacterium]